MTQARLKKIFHENLAKDLLIQVPDLKTVKLLVWINRFLSLMNSSEYYRKMISSPIIIVLDANRVGTRDDYLDLDVITGKVSQWNKSSSNVLIFDIDGRRIRDATYEHYTIDGEDAASELSAKYSLILFYIRALEVKLFLNGCCKYSADNIKTKKRTGEIRRTDLPPSEYRLLIEKHFKYSLLKGKRITYWDNKKKRILRQKPEDYFRNELHSYIQDNLTPEGIAEKEVTNASTGDKLDIRIIDTTNGIEFIIIEVKWMGRALSVKKAKDVNGKDIRLLDEIEMGDDSPNDGIRQLGIYLDDEIHAKRGSLVTYDVRTTDCDINWNIHQSEWHQKIDKPDIRLFIESDSASVKAKKLGQKAKQKKKS